MKSCGLVVNVLLLAGLCGCASHLATVKTKPARLPEGLRAEESLEPATRYLSVAEHEQPFAGLGRDLLAAKSYYGVLQRHPTNESSRYINNIIEQTSITACRLFLVAHGTSDCS